MPYRVLGHTGERVSAIGLGGWHLSFPRLDEQGAIRIIRTAIDRGINFMHQAPPSVDHPLVLVQANCWLGVGGA